MRYRFQELPGTDQDYVRPMVPVVVEGLERAPQLCLIDTGSLHNRFALWVAEAAGIELGDNIQSLALGGFQTEARAATIQLGIEGATWNAPVYFCDPWPLAFHILGQEGFLQWFKVTVRAAHYQVDVVPEQG